MHLFHGKIKRTWQELTLLLGLSQEQGPGSEVADTNCAGGVSSMPPATEGLSCEAFPACHQRHLVLQGCCVVADGDVVWMLGDQMRNFPDVSPKYFWRILGQCCIMYKGIVQSLGG